MFDVSFSFKCEKAGADDYVEGFSFGSERVVAGNEPHPTAFPDELARKSIRQDNPAVRLAVPELERGNDVTLRRRRNGVNAPKRPRLGRNPHRAEERGRRTNPEHRGVKVVDRMCAPRMAVAARFARLRIWHLLRRLRALRDVVPPEV